MAQGITTIQKNLNNFYHETTTSRPWRHVAGRISCIIRIPLYTVALLLNLTTTGFKVAITQHFCDKNSKWGKDGIKKDEAMTTLLINRIGTSIMGAIFAPVTNYRSIFESLTLIKNISIGNYHNMPLDKINSLHEIEGFYSDLIFDSDYNNSVGAKLKQG